MSVLVSYYIQGELGESLETPNAFLLNTANASRITFQQFLQAFPLPSSDLHFRFRKEDKQFGYIWQDMKQPNGIIPTYNSCVTAKILRMGDVTAVKRRSRLKLKASAPASVHGNASAPRTDSGSNESLKKPSRLGIKASRSAEADQGDEHVSYSPMSSPNSASTSASSSGTKKLQQRPSSSTLVEEQAPSEDLLFGGDGHGNGGDECGGGGGDSFASKPIVATPGKKHVTVNAYVPRDDDIDDDEAPSGGGDGGSGAGAASAKAEPLMMDLMGDAACDGKGDAGAPAAAASEALGFKHEMDRRHKKAAEDMDAARLRLQESVNNWATNNGEKRNVRTLLSTMHTLVNWPNCNWKPLTLSDVIEAKKVKLHYRKAMMVVHPDKASHLPPDGQYISRRVFEGINEAYHEFEKKESV